MGAAKGTFAGRWGYAGGEIMGRDCRAASSGEYLVHDPSNDWLALLVELTHRISPPKPAPTSQL